MYTWWMFVTEQIWPVRQLSPGYGSDQVQSSISVVQSSRWQTLEPSTAGRSDASGEKDDKHEPAVITGSPKMTGLDEAAKCYREQTEGGRYFLHEHPAQA